MYIRLPTEAAIAIMNNGNPRSQNLSGGIGAMNSWNPCFPASIPMNANIVGKREKRKAAKAKINKINFFMIYGIKLLLQ